MGARGSKSRRSELPEGRPMRSFHEALVREHDLRHDFDDIFEICDCIGQGGLCSIYKIRKKDDQIGGSSRPEHVRRRMHIRKYSAPLPRALSNKGFPLAMSLNERFLSQDPSSESNAAGPTNMHFALKVINLAMVKEDKIDQLKNEIEILKTLDHKNIIKAFETFQMRANKKLMIVMELCTGGDLFARLPYSERHATVCIKQILSAISYMHCKLTPVFQTRFYVSCLVLLRYSRLFRLKQPTILLTVTSSLKTSCLNPNIPKRP
jgi:serine/threonine protein kinase